VELRSHGGLLVRVKERTLESGAPTGAPAAACGGLLCEKGRFGLVKLLQAAGPGSGSAPSAGGQPLPAAEARARLEAALGKARQPLLRLSPVLAAEVLDRFLAFAAARGIPVQAEGLAGLEPGWVDLLRRPAPGVAGAVAAPGANGVPRILIAGGLDRANNVAFTDCLALQRRGQARLWYYGETEEVYERFFERILPDPALLAEGLKSAGGPAAVLVNPEQLLAESGKGAERKVLAALRAAGPEVRVTLYWNSRNAAYLLEALGRKGAGPEAPHDLLLDTGLSADGKAAVRWGLAPGAEADQAGLFIPLPRAAFLAGLGKPSGREPLQAGELDKALLQNLLVG
jgi:hypothetical protein